MWPEVEQMEPPEPVTLPVEPPDGMYSARLDDKGRLKLPSDFAQYLAALPEKKLFVTSLDRKTGHIYPIGVWRANKIRMSGHRQNPDAANRLMFTANELGGNAEMDAQNRILLPAELRQALNIENAQVRLCAFGRRIDIFSEPMVAQMRQQSMASPEKDLKELREAGLE